MDIETEMKCNRSHGVVVSCVHLMNQNGYPAHSEDVLAVRPIRATRVTTNGNHTVFQLQSCERGARRQP